MKTNFFSLSPLPTSREGKVGWVTCLIALLIISSSIHSQEFDESSLFEDTVTVTQAPLNNTEEISTDEKKLGVSGTVTSAISVIMPRKDFDTPLSSPSITADILLDARLKGGIKGFVSGEAVYSPVGLTSTTFTLPEAFIDINFRNKVYLRTGKQVLQWGRGYLWNPTDLINVERKTFVQRIGLREGAYGVKAHVPFGTRLNFYGFIDLRGADSLEKSAASFKTEFTVKSTEMAFAVWKKESKQPVFGYDFSSSLFGTSIAGEASLFRKDNEMFATINNDILKEERGEKEWATRAALTVNRSFSINGIPDRLALIAEGFYNSTGYSSSFIKDAASPNVSSQSGMNAILFAAMNGLYKPNEVSKYYVALFANISRFINSNMSLSVNAIGNIEQNSVLLYTALSYNDLRDLSINLSISGGIGPENTEYTLDLGPNLPIRNGLTTQLSAAISF
jgi:hypothetical protein